MINFIHFRPDPQDSKSGALTLAFFETSEPPKGLEFGTQGQTTLYFGDSFCCPKDNFCKAKGRKIAGGRLRHNCKENIFTVLKDGETARDVVIDLYNTALTNSSAIPRWAKKWVLSRHSNEPSIRVTEEKKLELEAAYGSRYKS